MKLTYLLLCLGLFIIFSCKKDAEQPILPNELTSITDIKIYFYKAKESSNLIKSINQTSDGYYQIQFEAGEIIVKQDLIKSYSTDEKIWKATFQFNDTTSLDTYLLGNNEFIADSIIDLNPYGTAPLSALAKIRAPVKGKFKIKVHGKGDDGIPIEKEFDAFDSLHELPVLGLYADFENMVEFSFMDENNNVRTSKLLSIKTDAVNANHTLNINQNSLPASDDGIIICSNLQVGFDQKGQIRWAYTGDALVIFRKLNNGNLIISSKQDLITYHSPAFYEVSMLGKTIKKYKVPNYLHHEVREMHNGNFLVATNTAGVADDNISEEDAIIEIDRKTGSIIKSWNFNTILDPLRKALPDSRKDDWLHINCVYFDETDNSLVVSGRSQSAVVKLDYESNEIKWILSDHTNWSEKFSKYLLKPIKDDGTDLDILQKDFWPSGQHAPLRLPNGNILLYDNGDFRGYYADNDVPQNSYSRAVEYKINEQNKTIELIWEYTYNKKVFTLYTGDVDYFQNNQHRLIGFMWSSDNSPKVVELNTNDEVIFDADILPKGEYYRIEKINLYKGIH